MRPFIVLLFMLLALYTYAAIRDAGAQQIPWNFIGPGSVPTSQLPSLAGDVTGGIAANKLSNVQGYPVATVTPASDGQMLCTSGSKWAPCATPTPVNVYSQIGAGNSTYGNNSAYAANLPIANETFPQAGKIVHLSVQNVTGGTCTTTAPTFNVYVIHGGVESDGTALTASKTQESITAGPTSLAENKAFVANDIIGMKMDSTNSPSGCNSPIFDVDILVCVGPAC